MLRSLCIRDYETCAHRWLASPLKADNNGLPESDAEEEEDPSSFISPNKRSRIITPANQVTLQPVNLLQHAADILLRLPLYPCTLL